MRDIVSPLDGIPSVFGGRRFDPRALFARAEPGIWLDPSDLTTLFQDSAGTTPVTAAGQPVGKVLDKSGRGNHATQATAASRPTYGVVPFGGRRNLLTYSEQLDNAIWAKTNVTVTANAAVAPDGTTTADLVLPNATLGQHRLNYTTTSTAAVHTFSVYVKAGGYDFTWIRIGGSGGYVDLTDGSVSLVTVGYTLTATDAGSGWWYVVLTGLAGVNDIARINVIAALPSLDFSGDTVSGIYAWGAQFELGSSTTAYQKVVSQYDVTEAGTVSLSYLSFDGVDDFLVTPTITPGTDKVQVFAGVRKLSDAAQGAVAELSASTAANNGTLLLAAPDGASATFAFDSKGTVQTDAVASAQTAPLTAVLAGLGDIAGDSAILRVNGAVADTDTGDQGTGNYLAYPVYIGRRGGASLPFNGWLYGMITRFGANLADRSITGAERWLNAKTGAF